jgi:hypothetical protein
LFFGARQFIYPLERSNMKENIAFTLVLAVATATVACAQQSSGENPADRPQVLVLGVYHMANRSHDIYNMHADDVLTP